MLHLLGTLKITLGKLILTNFISTRNNFPWHSVFADPLLIVSYIQGVPKHRIFCRFFADRRLSIRRSTKGAAPLLLS